MRVLVTGSTGTLGSRLVQQLIQRDHDVVGLSRRPGKNRAVGDVSTGVGIDSAVAGCDVIVHAASDPRGRQKAKATDIVGTQRLARFGIPMIYISIVGVDQSPFHYYRTKLAGENALIDSGTPWSILRATQFHEFIDMLCGMSRAAGARVPWRTKADAPVYFPKDWRLGPVAADEVARYLAEMVERGPSERIEQFGGPQSMLSGNLAEKWTDRRGGRFRVLPTVGGIARAFKAGVTVPSDPDGVGVQTWDEYLAHSARD